ncbi:hypothetical protein KIS1582_1389 [Cytobacillus firmus]|uniref:Uncharacterized protein n=1 Tax=Cytobacillus firmus TaxID=1399 RepID=A0A800NBC8_CYTFI|nr:hypothetical protein KIS1582_1389 [Cytobacillus firmus]
MFIKNKDSVTLLLTEDNESLHFPDNEPFASIQGSIHFPLSINM